MKKQALICLTLLFVLAPSYMMAQKKGSARQSTKSTTSQPKSDVDSVSYAYGLVLAENLPMYLKQNGILTDTAEIRSEYEAKIDSAKNPTKKSLLRNEMKAKIESITNENNKNIKEFLEGFNMAMVQNKGKKAMNAGLAIAGQMEMMFENFSTTLFGKSGMVNEKIFTEAFVSSLQNENPIIDFGNAQEYIDQKMSAAEGRSQQIKDAGLGTEYKDVIEENNKFFAENEEKEGVVELPSGLQYKSIVMGRGAKPTRNDKVKVHYKGTFLDGTTFDSSYERNEPAEFGVTSVIPGWTEALLLMPVGSKWVLYIPYNLAYGTQERGPIKPFSTLIFEIELLDIIKGEE